MRSAAPGRGPETRLRRQPKNEPSIKRHAHAAWGRSSDHHHFGLPWASEGAVFGSTRLSVTPPCAVWAGSPVRGEWRQLSPIPAQPGEERGQCSFWSRPLVVSRVRWPRRPWVPREPAGECDQVGRVSIQGPTLVHASEVFVQGCGARWCRSPGERGAMSPSAHRAEPFAGQGGVLVKHDAWAGQQLGPRTPGPGHDPGRSSRPRLGTVPIGLQLVLTGCRNLHASHQSALVTRRQPPARLLAMTARKSSTRAASSSESSWRTWMARADLLSWPWLMTPCGSGAMGS